MQAIHDILFHGADLDKYDHHDFPGVVPRTFIGSLFISGCSFPFVQFAKFIGLTKFDCQYLVRGVLASLVLFGVFRLHRSVCKNFSASVGKWFLVITAHQFHFMFYLSRPLPNIFALILVLLAFDWWLQYKHGLFIWSSAFAIVIFRSELCILMGLILLMELVTCRLSFTKAILHAIPAGVIALAFTILVDSWFWKRWLWPEGEVLYYNVILNKSSDWGTLPFLWYFYSAIPRALIFSSFLVPVGAYLDSRCRQLITPSIGFVLLYSFLPHKELRFIVYVFPILNVAVASACTRLYLNRRKSLIHSLMALGSCSHVIFNSFAVGIFIFVSHYNYPGGEALVRLQKLEPTDLRVNVHIDNFAAQTGITRFTQYNQNWIFDKTEGLKPGGADMMKFTHLIVGITSSNGHKELQPYRITHKVLGTVNAFHKIQPIWNGSTFGVMPFKVLLQSKVYILKKKIKTV
ncbi:dol-P-Man:Man(7)GlcNAc(2)-PP-Dol alpha-1,6-mannosyltransferase-like isoform X2 [Tubulanus polymorphus]